MINGIVIINDENFNMIVTWDGYNKFHVYNVWDTHHVLDVDSFICHVNNYNEAKTIATEYLGNLRQELVA